VMVQLKEIISGTDKTAKQILLEFLEEQKQTWPLMAANYASLDKVEEKIFLIDNFKIKVQFNPKRIQSSAANVDMKSIAERKCFLCDENRPVEQKTIGCSERFQILVNPFPIFHNHFTITSRTHTDQRFLSNIAEMLKVAEAIEGLTVFYNGPECGASAPDHLHFQAGENGFMPVEAEFETLKNNHLNLLFSKKTTATWAFDNYLRKMISVETTSFKDGLTTIEYFFKQFHNFQLEKTEPMLNVLCYFSNGNWTIHLFPRKLHRPSQFFATGNDQLLISPASVDFGGIFITPRKEDFDKISSEDIADIFEQITIDQPIFDQLKTRIKTGLKF
jgi:ATP adenylyltransferase/5',5'''-P-1,P-4-tetraphosphate phosphorylase II